jgi:hypothetical protein
LRGGVNLYGYALQNPANWIDPFGMKTLCDAMNEVANSDSFVNDERQYGFSPFTLPWYLNQEVIPHGGFEPGNHNMEGAHFYDDKVIQADIQYVQVGWAATRSSSRNPWFPMAYMGGWMILAGIKNIFGEPDNYFDPENIWGNYTGLLIGTIGGMSPLSFKWFSTLYCAI